MKLTIYGDGTLAAAIRTCCNPYHELTTIHDADLAWMCDDTPIDPLNGLPNVEEVIAAIRRRVDGCTRDPLILISSQVPIGTTARLEKLCPYRSFAYSPENIRVKTAVEDFRHQSRIVIGRRDPLLDEVLRDLLAPFTNKLIFTDPETAEMSKHALNAYLGLNIAFINEIARLAAPLGVDMCALEEALLTERRISPNAPLHAGPAFGGGHLLRDIAVLELLSQQVHQATPIIEAIRTSNAQAVPV